MSYPAGYPGSCPTCRTRREVSGAYDAAFCPVCDQWQTPRCRHCPECRTRPARPSDAPELDVAPHEIHPSYDLDLSDTAEVLRRLVLPTVAATLPAEHVVAVGLGREAGGPQEHWPPDVPWPDHVTCVITLSSGEREEVYLGEDGWVDPEDVADRLVMDLEDLWCESRLGWGQRIDGSARVLPRREG